MENKFYKAIMLEIKTAEKLKEKKPSGMTMSGFVEMLLNGKYKK